MSRSGQLEPFRGTKGGRPPADPLTRVEVLLALLIIWRLLGGC
jgi:hypothetical protein